MKTDVITVSSKGARMEAALIQADKVAVYKELGRFEPQGPYHLLESDGIADISLKEMFCPVTEEDMGICARAAYRVAMAYKHGKGVEADLAQTVKWLKKAAKLGNSEAMFTLGQYSERGEGMRKSPKIAVRWYEAAAQLEHQRAIERLKAIGELH